MSRCGAVLRRTRPRDRSQPVRDAKQTTNKHTYDPINKNKSKANNPFNQNTQTNKFIKRESKRMWRPRARICSRSPGQSWTQAAPSLHGRAPLRSHLASPLCGQTTLRRWPAGAQRQQSTEGAACKIQARIPTWGYRFLKIEVPTSAPGWSTSSPLTKDFPSTRGRTTRSNGTRRNIRETLELATAIGTSGTSLTRMVPDL